jgi:hypothetical protein
MNIEKNTYETPPRKVEKNPAVILLLGASWIVALRLMEKRKRRSVMLMTKRAKLLRSISAKTFSDRKEQSNQPASYRGCWKKTKAWS